MVAQRLCMYVNITRATFVTANKMEEDRKLRSKWKDVEEYKYA